MSKEVTISCSLAYSDSNGVADSLQVATGTYSVTTKVMQRGTVSVPTTAAALNLGNVTALGWIMLINKDPTNFVTLLTGTGGIVFAKLWPGLPAGPFFFGSGVTAPFIKSDTAVCIVDYLLISI